METLSFVIYGEPIPQGSTRAFIPKGWKRPIITADNKRTKTFRQDISGTAKELMEKQDFAQVMKPRAVEVGISFFFARPKSLKKSIMQKTTRPDLDKLIRTVLDALSGIVFEDDCQVIALNVKKDFSSQPSAHIRVSVLGQ